MLMPVLRLLLIYCVLALVVVGVFKREMIARLILGQPELTSVIAGPEAASAQPGAAASGQIAVAPQETAVTTDDAPAEVAAAPALPEPEPEPAKRAVPGRISSLQTPVADAPSPVATAEMPVVEHPAVGGETTAGTGQTVFPTPPAEPTEPPTTISTEPPAEPTIAAAREAYWKGNYDEAETMLAALVAEDPANPDVIGELGNLQYSQRRFAQAADSYRKAAELLTAQGRGAQAHALLAVLRQLDPAMASALANSFSGQ